MASPPGPGPRSGRPIAVPNGGFRSISVLRLSSLGDVVLTLPAVQALRRAFPAARLRYWVKEEYADAVRFDPAVDHVRALERDARRIEDLVAMGAELEEDDLVVDLHGSLRTRVMTLKLPGRVLRSPPYRLRREALLHARALRLPVPPPVLERHARALRRIGVDPSSAPRLHCGPEAETRAGELAGAWTRPAVALLPAARHFTKRWPEGRWLELHDALRARGWPLLYCSLPAELEGLAALAARASGDPEVRWCTEPLPVVAALLSRCAAAVTGDTGLMHVAAARGVRVVALFGSTDPRLGFAPAGEGHEVLCRREPCQPCTLHGRPACPRGHFRCMRGLGGKEVLEALDRVLARGPAA